MNQVERVNAFIELGKCLASSYFDRETVFAKAHLQNNWFTPSYQAMAFEGIQKFLQPNALHVWLEKYDLPENKNKNIGVVMAGNIPMVGFHDFLCVLICGYTLHAKLSSQDTLLLPEVFRLLTEIEPRYEAKVMFAERLNEVDAVIATGSDNSSRYFEYYFSKKPHIIRKNRTSVAVITGRESKEDYIRLGQDIFSYFGLGCRNVSMLYAPSGYNFIPFYDAIEEFGAQLDLHKYKNNYNYNRTIFLIKNIPHLDNHFLLLTPSEELVSPIGVLHYSHYEDFNQLEEKLKTKREKIQVIVSKEGTFPGSIPFGQAQEPALWDYADGVDTMKFLIGL